MQPRNQGLDSKIMLGSRAIHGEAGPAILAAGKGDLGSEMNVGLGDVLGKTKMLSAWSRARASV